MSRGKNDPFPMSARVLTTGVQLPGGPFKYGMMKPSRSDGMRGAERFLGWPFVWFSPEVVAAYIKQMYPELKGACRVVDLDEVIINPRGTAGPCFRGKNMVQAIREHPDLIGIPHYRFGSRVLFKMAPKYEILPVEKLETGTPRTFAFPDFHHKIRWTRLVQHFNQYIQTLKWYRPVSGSISLVDDWDDFWRVLDQYLWKIINDFRKYDSGYPKLMHAAMCLVRLWAFDSSVTDEEKKELKYYYNSLQELLVVLPNGQVVNLDNGQISGQPSTTTDNSVVSSFMLDLAFSVIAWSNELQKPIDDELVHYALIHRHRDVDKLVRIKTGGDDSASATDMPPQKYREALDLVSRRHGFAVKNEDFKVTQDITECGFLGGRAYRREGRFVYTPKDPRKMLESMFLQKATLSVEEEYNKLLSLAALLWNTELFDRGYEVYHSYYMQESRRTRLAPPLTKDQIRAFWLGQEVAGLTRPQQGALSVRHVLSAAAGDFSTFYSPTTVSTVLARARGPEMKASACNTIATKKQIQEAIKHEAKKEIQHEIAAANARPKKKKNKGKRRNQGNSVVSSVPSVLPTKGYGTRVLGTGVLAPQLAGFTPRKVIIDGGRACLWSTVDYVGTVKVSSTNALGDILFSLPLSPLLVPATRTNIEAQNWEKFQVLQWEFFAVGTSGTQTNGQVLTFVDPDPQDNWTNEALNLNKAASQYGAIPKNVYQEWVVGLPMSSDMRTTTYFTNPTTTSDVRFTQPGVLRVINCGGFQGLTSTPTELYHIYQKPSLKFMDPELNVSATSIQRPVATVTFVPPGGSMPTTAGSAVFTQNATIATGVPLTISSNGSVTVDTSEIGDNNLVIEIAAEVTNASDTAPTVAIDSNLGTSWMDAIVSAARMIESSKSPGQLFQTSVQYLLSGSQSWQFQAIWAGVAAVSVTQVIMKVWTVPPQANTLQVAHGMGVTKRQGHKPRKVGVPSNPIEYYSSASWYGYQQQLGNVTANSKLMDFLLSRVSACGLNATYTVLPSNQFTLSWNPSGGEQYTLSMGVYCVASGWNSAQTCNLLGTSGVQNVVRYNGTPGTTDLTVSQQYTFVATGTGPITLTFTDYISSPTGTINTVWAWFWLSTATYDTALNRSVPMTRGPHPVRMESRESRLRKAPASSEESLYDDSFVVVCDNTPREPAARVGAQDGSRRPLRLRSGSFLKEELQRPDTVRRPSRIGCPPSHAQCVAVKGEESDPESDREDAINHEYTTAEYYNDGCE